MFRLLSRLRLAHAAIAAVGLALVSILFAPAPAEAKDNIVVCTIDDLTGDFSIMATPKTYGYQLATKEVNDAGGIMVDGKKKMIKLITYDGQSDVKRYQELSQKCIFDDEADVVMAAYTGAVSVEHPL